MENPLVRGKEPITVGRGYAGGIAVGDAVSYGLGNGMGQELLDVGIGALLGSGVDDTCSRRIFGLPKDGACRVGGRSLRLGAGGCSCRVLTRTSVLRCHASLKMC